MKVQSFRSIITVSLIVVISTISYFAFQIYSNALERKIFEESEQKFNSTLTVLNLLKGQIYYSIDEHNGKIIESLMDNMYDRSILINAYLFDAGGEIKHSFQGDSSLPEIRKEELASLVDGCSFKSFPNNSPPLSRAFINMQNAPSCYECHSPEQKTLGYLVFDLEAPNTFTEVNYARKSSIFFSITMVIIIISIILFMHYRFVRKNLREFNQTIDAVNNGNLQRRLSIPETRELGKLGRNFNDMLDTFYKAQKELEDFHSKEMRSNYKLATIGEMSARLAHEIRNPMTGIANAIEILMKETHDLDNIPILEEVQRQANRVNGAVTDLLKYSRKRDLNLIVNNINEVIEQLVFFLKNQARNKEIEFIVKLQEDIPHFRFDHEQIEDALLNMGLNAIREIKREGSITFTTSWDPGKNRIHIRITDNGPGIPDEILSNLFHPFFTTHHEGTGLGLAIVKDIVKKHDGDVWAENNEPGGATFTISLPLNL